MEDIDSAVVGQVSGSQIKNGYNDAGWDIVPDNYSRFISQIDPDKYDQAYWAIGTGGQYERNAKAVKICPRISF